MDKKLIRAALPWVFVPLGAVVGVAFGLAQLLWVGRDVDYATAFGLTVFMQCTIGWWLGLVAFVKYVHIMSGWIERLSIRMEAVLEAAEAKYGNLEDKRPRTITLLWWWASRVSVFTAPWAFACSAHSIVGVAIDMGADTHSTDVVYWAGLISVALSCLCVLSLCAYLFWAGRLTGRLERLLAATDQQQLCASVRPSVIKESRLAEWLSAVMGKPVPRLQQPRPNVISTLQVNRLS